MTWLDEPMLALDTETTSPDPETARVVQACVGRSSYPGDWRPLTMLVNPGVPIPAESTAVHHITDEDVQAEGVDPESALATVWQQLDRAASYRTPIVAHNAAFDLTLLDRESRRHLGCGLPGGLIVLDTLCLFRRFDWRTGGRTLTKLAERHGITFPAHDAGADALACLRLLHILAGLNDLLPLIEPEVLHRAQAGWWVAQQDAAEAHAQGNGTPFTRQDHWPFIPSAA